MAITSAQGYEMRITRRGTGPLIRPTHIGKPLNGCWPIEESIILPAFSLTRYVISTRRKARREADPWTG